MDVQAASASVVTSGTVPPAEVATPAAVSQSPEPQSAPSAPAPQQTQAPQQNSHQTIAPAIAKLFGGGSSPQPISLNVSYRILKGDLGEIVTVFTDPKSGKEVAQFPPEILIGLASFFDQESGVTLDTNA